MQLPTLIAAVALTGAVLVSAPAQAWRDGPGNTPVTLHHYHPVDARPIIIRGVNFEHNSDMLTHESTLILDALALALKSQPHGTLQVIGHASAEGDAAYNLDLSTRRAKAVRDWLVFRGVPAGALQYGGQGERYPLADNVSDAGRVLNRRVELVPVMQVAY